MTAKSIADILDAAADLITPEGAWTQRFLARNASGSCVLPETPEAVCFCGYGAIIRAGGYRTSDPNPTEWRILDRLTSGGRFPDWNDAPERTQTEVVAMLREAATLARTSTPGEA